MQWACVCFGGRAEAGPAVHSLLRETVDRAVRDWRALGSRDEASARSFLTARLRRLWGVTAARANARIRLSRMRFVGLSRDQVLALRKEPRAPAAGRDPSHLSVRSGVERFDAHDGAMLRPPECAGD